MNEHLKRVSADVQMVYSRIEDDTSRQIFENRLMMALTKNERKNDEIEFLRAKRDKDKRLVPLFNEIKRLEGDIFIFGAGECGRYIVNSKFMKGIPVRGFIDNREWREDTIHNLPVYQFEDAVINCENANVILSMRQDDRSKSRSLKRETAGI